MEGTWSFSTNKLGNITRCCLTLVGGGSRVQGDLKSAFDFFVLSRPQSEDYGYSAPKASRISQFLDTMGARMSTDVKNQLAASFEPRLHRYMQHKFGLQKKMCKKFVYDSFDRKNKQPSIAQQELKNWLQLYPSEANLSKEGSFNHFLKLSWEILKCMETEMVLGCIQRKLFCLLPLKRSYVPGCIDIQTSHLSQMIHSLRQSGYKITKKQRRAERNLKRGEVTGVWNAFFKIRKASTVSKESADCVSTDGVSVSVYRKVLRRDEDDYTIWEDKFINDVTRVQRDVDEDNVDILTVCISDGRQLSITATDPGRKRLASAVCGGFNGKDVSGRRYLCRTKNYRHNARINDSIRHSCRYRETNNEFADPLKNISTFKVSSVKEYTLNLSILFRHCGTLFAHSEKIGFRQWRFKVHRFREKELYRIAVCVGGAAKMAASVVRRNHPSRDYIGY